MNGILSKWTNNVFRWQCRYFTIDEDKCQLIYFTSIRNQELGIYKDFMDLKNAKLILSDGTQFHIENDNKKFRLKAKNKNERYLWVNALKRTNRNEIIDLNRSWSIKEDNVSSLSEERIWYTKQNSVGSLNSFNEKRHDQLEGKDYNSISNFRFDDDFNTDFDKNFEKINNFPTVDEMTEMENLCLSASSSDDYFSINSCHFCSGDNCHDKYGANHCTNNEDEFYDELYDNDDYQCSPKTDVSIISHLLGQLKIGMDLSKITLPVHILERRSMLEMYGDFLAHADLWLDIVKIQTEEDRMLACLKWYLSAFHTSQKSEVAKKSYNPVLGEIFKCQYKVPHSYECGKNESVSFISEQVSHHPPISAFYAENENKTLLVTGNIHPKSRFSGIYVSIEMIGNVRLKVVERDEEYILTFPTAYCNSIFTSPWTEFGGNCSITCSKTGYKSTINFKTKGLFGKKDRIEARVYRPNETEAFYVVDGDWKGVMRGKLKLENDYHTFLDIGRLRKMRKLVTPRLGQEEFESRKLWEIVTKHLKDNNIKAASQAKHQIEEKQRNEAKLRLADKTSWQLRNFIKICDNYEYVGNK